MRDLSRLNVDMPRRCFKSLCSAKMPSGKLSPYCRKFDSLFSVSLRHNSKS